ncbi:MAG TPA: hypothetical protein VIY98_06960 [Nitrososphaeraceae archaeon]
MLSSDEKETIVIEMLKKGYPIREIAKAAQKSFSAIGEINRRIFGESASYKKKKKKLSKTAQALELFSQGKSPIEVSIELDFEPKDVEKVYLNYLGLTGLTQLVRIYQELGKYLPDFISFYWSFNEAGADNKKIKEILDMANRLPELALEIKRLQIERKNLEIPIQNKNNNLQYLDNQIEIANNIFSTELTNLEDLRHEAARCRMQLQNLKKLLNDIANKNEYQNLEKKVEDMVMKIISEKSVNLSLVLVAVLEALRNDPSKYEIIFTYLDTFKNGNIKGEDLQSKENYAFFNSMSLLQEIDKIYKKLYKVYSNKIISNIIGAEYN